MTEDGWFRTGDVVTMTPDGYMTITDRTKDLVKSGGEWISTVELESVIIGHPKVLEAAVIAIPDEKWSERPMACVVRTQDGWDLTAEELQTYLGERVAQLLGAGACGLHRRSAEDQCRQIRQESAAPPVC